MRTRYRAIARVEKTHGKRGEVVTVPVHGLPAYVCAGMEVALVPPALKGPRLLHVSEAGEADPGQLVRFREVMGIDAAKSLVGRTVLAKVEDLPADFALHDRERLVGREVCDAPTGERIGVIEEVYAGIANDVWLVKDEGPAHLYRVEFPVIDQVVREVPSEGPIPITLRKQFIVSEYHRHVDRLPTELEPAVWVDDL